MGSIFCSIEGREISDSIAIFEKQLEQNNSPQERVDLLNHLAWHNIFEDPSKCKGYLDEALELAKEHHYRKGEASTHDIWGTILRMTGVYEESLRYHLKSLKISEEINWEMGIGITYTNIGIVYAESGQDEQALEFLLKALPYKKRSGDSTGVFLAYGDIINIYLKLDELDSALEYNQLLLDYKKSQNTPGEYATAYYNFASIHAKLGEDQRATEYLDLAEEQLAILSNKWVEIQINKLRGEILAKQGRHDDALKKINRAYIIADKYHMVDVRGKTAGILSDLYAHTGDLQKAYEFQNIQNELLVKSFSSNAHTKTALLTARYDMQKEQMLLESRYQYRMAIVFIAIAVLLMMLCVAIAFAFIFNRKKEKLRVAYAEIEQQNQLIETQKLELVESNAAKDKVFSIIAHDLRSPLASLSSLLELYNRDYIGIEELREMMDDLSHNVNSVNETLSQLLHWAKNQLQGIKSSPREVRLYDIVQEKMELFETAAKNKDIIIRSTVSPDHQVFVDEDQIKLVVHNFINNALKFTPEGGKIILSSAISTGEKTIELSVEDTGVGLSETQINQLFKLSSLGSTFGTNGEKGTGLGLMLCKEMIESNHGELLIESTPGKGSRFSVRLPVAIAEIDSSELSESPVLAESA